jgi:small subunit ribosomal protein S20
VKTAIKEVRSSLESKDIGDAAKVLSKAASVISRAGSKGILHRKNVARKVARLSRAIHKAVSGTP